MGNFMKKIVAILLFASILSLMAFAAETVNLTAFPDESTIISTPRYDHYTYPAEFANGIYGTNGQITADINEARILTEEEQADISNIEYGISAIGVRNFGRANADQFPANPESRKQPPNQGGKWHLSDGTYPVYRRTDRVRFSV